MSFYVRTLNRQLRRHTCACVILPHGMHFASAKHLSRPSCFNTKECVLVAKHSFTHVCGSHSRDSPIQPHACVVCCSKFPAYDTAASYRRAHVIYCGYLYRIYKTRLVFGHCFGHLYTARINKNRLRFGGRKICLCCRK